MIPDIKVGHGYDVHRLDAGRKLIIGGVDIPYEYGLLGHSDADVLVHAVLDALIGAMGLGDIGKHFPDTDPAYSGISSMILAGKAAELLGENGYSVGMPEERVNIKATTEESLGFTGRCEGIAAHAVCLIVRESR